jgi:DNA mismatch repair protein MutS
VARAHDVLDALEKGEREGGDRQKTLIDDLPLFSATPAPAAQPLKASPVRDRLKDIHPDMLTPREALELIYELKELDKT